MLIERHSYLDTSIDFIITDIIEYDIQSAGFSMIKAHNLLPKKTIEYLDGLEKTKRNIVIGNLNKKVKGISKTINEHIKDYRVQFYIENELTEEDILSIKKDAIYTKKYCHYLEFEPIEDLPIDGGNIEDRPVIEGKDDYPMVVGKDNLGSSKDMSIGTTMEVFQPSKTKEDSLAYATLKSTQTKDFHNGSTIEDNSPMVVGKDNSQKGLPHCGSIGTTMEVFQPSKTKEDSLTKNINQTQTIIKFIPKNIYSAYLYLDKKEMYYNRNILDVKGINDKRLILHEDYMCKFLYDMITILSRYDNDLFKKKLVAFADKYKRRELHPGYYREFNDNSQYKVMIDDHILGIDQCGDPLICDISYNYMHIIVPLLGLVI